MGTSALSGREQDPAADGDGCVRGLVTAAVTPGRLPCSVGRGGSFLGSPGTVSSPPKSQASNGPHSHTARIDSVGGLWRPSVGGALRGRLGQFLTGPQARANADEVTRALGARPSLCCPGPPPPPPGPPPTRRPPVLGGRCLALGEPVDFSSRPSPKAVSERGRSQAQRAPRVTGDPAVRGLPPRCVLCRRRRREQPGSWPAPDGGAWGHHGHSPEPGPGSLGRLLDFLLSERRGQARGRSNTRRPVAAASQGPSLLQTHEMTSNGLPWGKQG